VRKLWPVVTKRATGVKHLVLGMARAELGADGVPGGLEELHLLVRLHDGGALGEADDPLQLGMPEVSERGRQHDEGAAGELAQGIDHRR